MTYVHGHDDDDFIEVEEELERIDPRPLDDDIECAIKGEDEDRDDTVSVKTEVPDRDFLKDQNDRDSIPPMGPIKEEDTSDAEVASVKSATSTGLTGVFDEKLDLDGLIQSRLEVGHFSTDEIRTWDKPRPFNMSPRKFSQPFSLDGPAPTVIHGLSGMDVCRSRNARVKALSSNVSCFGFTAHNNAWGDTILFRAQSSFLASDGVGTDVDCGTVNVREGFHQTEKPIRFNARFTTPPTVLVWLSAVDVEQGRNMRIKCAASDITEEGFKLQLESWWDTLLHNGTEATWFAYAEDKRGVASGRFHTRRAPGDICKGKVQFVPEGDKEIFKKAPKIFLAFDFLDVDKSRNSRIWVRADKVTRSGFEWSIQAWAGTHLHMVGATYIAVE